MLVPHLADVALVSVPPRLAEAAASIASLADKGPVRDEAVDAYVLPVDGRERSVEDTHRPVPPAGPAAGVPRPAIQQRLVLHGVDGHGALWPAHLLPRAIDGSPDGWSLAAQRGRQVLVQPRTIHACSATADVYVRAVRGTSASVHPCQASASGGLMDHIVVAVVIAVATANLKLDVGHVPPCC